MKSNGFSLIEFTLASFLTSLLMLGVMEAYLSLHKSYQMQQKLARMQEDGRFISFYLHRVINSIDACSNLPANNTKRLIGYPNSNLPLVWQVYLRSRVKKGSDAFIVSGCYPINGKIEYMQAAYFIDAANNLYEKILVNGRSQKLISGVGQLNIKYGVRDDNKPLMYLLSNAINNWQHVESLDITLTIADKKWYLYIKLPNQN